VPLPQVESIDELMTIYKGLEGVKIYQDRNVKGKNMYSCALMAFINYRRCESPEELEQDVGSILSDDKIQATEKLAYITARVGQGKYRQKLIGYWGQCALTGFNDVRFLVASHIKPWRASDNQEKLDLYNGLLLLPNIDKAFDLGFITFSDKGKIIISPQLEESERLGITTGMNIKLESPHQIYMKYHREKVFH
jgi:predicted restriction endonuclease